MVAGFSAAGLAVWCGGAAGAPHVRVTPPKFVVAEVRGAVARLGAHPLSAYFVLTRRQDANEVLDGDGVNSDRPVYTVVVKGRFKVARPGPQAKGFVHVSVVFYVIDARTGRETDGGFRDTLPDLSKLGTINNLLPYISSH